MYCLTCGVEIAPPRNKYCTDKCKCKDHQRKRGNTDSYRYYSKTPRNFFQSLRQKKSKDRLSISLDFLETLWEKQQGLCALSGHPMTHVRGSGRVMTNVSIDRIDSYRGYEEDNIQLVCHIVNLMKQQLTVDELKMWCRRILNG